MLVDPGSSTIVVTATLTGSLASLDTVTFPASTFDSATYSDINGLSVATCTHTYNFTGGDSQSGNPFWILDLRFTIGD